MGTTSIFSILIRPCFVYKNFIIVLFSSIFNYFFFTFSFVLNFYLFLRINIFIST